MKRRKMPLDSLIQLTIRKRKWIEKLFLVVFLLSLICFPFVGINYDLSEYLPEDAPSKAGLNVMEREFGYPGTARVMIGPDLSIYEAKHYKDRIAAVDGVDLVLWLDTTSDIYESELFLAQEDLSDYYKDGYACMDVTFVEGDSSKLTHRALDEIKEITGEKGFLTGSAVQNKALAETLFREIAVALVIGVVMIYLVLTLTTKSWFEPVLFLLIMGIAIVINMGTNIFLGTISFLTFSVAALLQLAIAMDYSIFLLHSFQREKEAGFTPEEAMANAVHSSLSSILSSGATTVVGFIVLALMRFSIGRDMGIVLAKGIVISLLTVLLLMPALVLRWTGRIERTEHRSFMPSFDGFGRAVYKARYVLLAVIAVLIVPAYTAQAMNSFLYGNGSLGSSEGTQTHEDEVAINERFGRSNLILALVPNSGVVTEKELTDAIEAMPETKKVISLAGSLPEGVPESILPESLTGLLHTENYARLLITVRTADESPLAYRVSDEIKALVTQYYPEDSYVVGVTPSTQDIQSIITSDYSRVNLLSLLGVAIVILITFKSPVIPIVVMIPIEVAIFFNMGLPYIYGERMIFMGYIIVSCLQLGATIDYSILVTNNYLDSRVNMEKREAAVAAISKSALSVLTSGSILTIAGYGLFFVCDVAAIADIGRLVGRGALMSLFLVLGLLPVLLVLTDRIIFNQKRRARKLQLLHTIRQLRMQERRELRRDEVRRRLKAYRAKGMLTWKTANAGPSEAAEKAAAAARQVNARPSETAETTAAAARQANAGPPAEAEKTPVTVQAAVNQAQTEKLGKEESSHEEK